MAGIFGDDPDGYLREVEYRARRFSGAFTGTAGTLAADALRLLTYVKKQGGATMDANPTTAEQLLATATATIKQRRGTYGPPREHFSRTVAAVNAIFAGKLREPLTEADWACIMILDKLARHQGAAKSIDTPVDLAGYAACLAECEA